METGLGSAAASTRLALHSSAGSGSCVSPSLTEGSQPWAGWGAPALWALSAPHVNTHKQTWGVGEGGGSGNDLRLTCAVISEETHSSELPGRLEAEGTGRGTARV